MIDVCSWQKAAPLKLQMLLSLQVISPGCELRLIVDDDKHARVSTIALRENWPR